MKAIEVLEKLNAFSGATLAQTVDTLKIGDNDKQVCKVAFCFTATVDIIKEASEWGADVLITHEPTYFDHFDNFTENPVNIAKRDMLTRSGMTVYRWHDHAHAAVPDVIHMGFLCETELKGTLDGRFFILEQPMTALQLAAQISKKAGIKYPRIAGATDKPITKIGVCLGACGGMVFDVIRDTDCQAVIAGEVCEWREGCYVRDAAKLGMNKSLIVLGHCASERDGMKYLTSVFESICPEIESKYFEAEELYSYSE